MEFDKKNARYIAMEGDNYAIIDVLHGTFKSSTEIKIHKDGFEILVTMADGTIVINQLVKATDIGMDLDGPEVGYQSCACRDCMEIAIGIPGAFCNECEEADCEVDSDCQCEQTIEDE